MKLEIELAEIELAEIESKRATILSKIEAKKSRLKFQCGCGKKHSINKCDLIQTHWYTMPYGCTDGDYWNDGEIQIICPLTNIRNRVMFDRNNVPYEKRNHYDYCAESQFKRLYYDLFKSRVDEYDSRRNFHNGTLTYRNGPIPPEDKGHVNNYYFDKNHKKFGLKIKTN